MHVQHAIAAHGEFAIVSDQHESRAALALAAEQKLDDFAPGCLVEVSGRLVGDDDGRIGGERAGERDTLLLAAGKLGGIMVEPLCEPDGGKLACRSV